MLGRSGAPPAGGGRRGSGLRGRRGRASGGGRLLALEQPGGELLAGRLLVRRGLLELGDAGGQLGVGHLAAGGRVEVAAQVVQRALAERVERRGVDAVDEGRDRRGRVAVAAGDLDQRGALLGRGRSDGSRVGRRGRRRSRCGVRRRRRGGGRCRRLSGRRDDRERRRGLGRRAVVGGPAPAAGREHGARVGREQLGGDAARGAAVGERQPVLGDARAHEPGDVAGAQPAPVGVVELEPAGPAAQLVAARAGPHAHAADPVQAVADADVHGRALERVRAGGLVVGPLPHVGVGLVEHREAALVDERRVAALDGGGALVDQLVGGPPAAGHEHVEPVHDGADVDVEDDVGVRLGLRPDAGLHDLGRERAAGVDGGLGERRARAAGDRVKRNSGHRDSPRERVQ